MKFYAVRKGRQTGLFRTWAECQAQTAGFSGAEFKSFPSEAEAQTWLTGVATPAPVTVPAAASPLGRPVAYCDGSANEGRAGYGLVVNGLEHYARVPGPEQTNQIAELTALLATLQIAYNYGWKGVEIHTDSQYAIKCATEWYYNWERNGWRTASGEAVKHQETIRGIVTYLRATGAILTWVKGHSGILGNERADQLAEMGRRLSP